MCALLDIREIQGSPAYYTYEYLDRSIDYRTILHTCARNISAIACAHMFGGFPLERRKSDGIDVQMIITVSIYNIFSVQHSARRCFFSRFDVSKFLSFTQKSMATTFPNHIVPRPQYWIDSICATFCAILSGKLTAISSQ
jgi:hypothetical protein